MSGRPDRGTNIENQSPRQGPGVADVVRGGLVVNWVAALDPGWFALVMASGIISVGAELLGFNLLSSISLVITAVAFVVLTAAYLARAVAFPDRFKASLRDPRAAMAFFTLVAGTDVLSVRLIIAGHPMVGVVLGAAAALTWLVLTYGLPCAILARVPHPVLRDVNGTWLLWVVATQSLAIVAAGLAQVAPWSSLRQGLPSVAVCFWSVGVMLYLVLIVVVALRLILVEVTPGEMGPAYWIAMGATAISVRAAAGILVLRDRPPSSLVHEMHPILVGLSVLLWAFGTWWIPLLVLFGVWRHLVRRYPLSFETRQWSIVFPLGMYTVASVSLGRAAQLGFMVAVARAWLWVGVAAWVATLVSMLVALSRALLRPRGGTG
jgi:tellurite resistance protein TehA-like permease